MLDVCYHKGIQIFFLGGSIVLVKYWDRDPESHLKHCSSSKLERKIPAQFLLLTVQDKIQILTILYFLFLFLFDSTGFWKFTVHGRRCSFNLYTSSHDEAWKWTYAIQDVIDSKPQLETPFQILIKDIRVRDRVWWLVG